MSTGQSNCHCILVKILRILLLWVQLLFSLLLVTVTVVTVTVFCCCYCQTAAKQFKRIVLKCRSTQFWGSGDDFPNIKWKIRSLATALSTVRPFPQCAFILRPSSAADKQRFSCTNRRWATSPFLVTVAQFSTVQDATWELGMQDSLKGGGWAEGVPQLSEMMIKVGYGSLQVCKSMEGLWAGLI